ncbi:hypothetical protein BpHYR1_005820 [Brachionus plicatilis]|uniref:Uncharacterized protein n=1 Tax=Brachionus plicatilis TaxID=10195 RepID=A0A3M7SNG5_BRAPC|nr:hypothetical protein BpHYR1_005820 [Brachionus plicatilis]
MYLSLKRTICKNCSKKEAKRQHFFIDQNFSKFSEFCFVSIIIKSYIISIKYTIIVHCSQLLTENSGNLEFFLIDGLKKRQKNSKLLSSAFINIVIEVCDRNFYRLLNQQCLLACSKLINDRFHSANKHSL